MDSSESNSAEHVGPADGCPYRVRLGAYADGELDAPAVAMVEQHLAKCEQCRLELEEIRELSALAGGIGAAGISARRVRKIHRLIDADQRNSVFRIAVAMTSLAASVMVVGGVWLSELPTTRPPQIVVNPYSPQPSWEQTAIEVDLHPVPMTAADPRTQPMYADAGLANWVLNGLSGKPR